jgi:hypothetical protein
MTGRMVLHRPVLTLSLVAGAKTAGAETRAFSKGSSTQSGFR